MDSMAVSRRWGVWSKVQVHALRRQSVGPSAGRSTYHVNRKS